MLAGSYPFRNFQKDSLLTCRSDKMGDEDILAGQHPQEWNIKKYSAQT